MQADMEIPNRPIFPYFMRINFPSLSRGVFPKLTFDLLITDLLACLVTYMCKVESLCFDSLQDSL